MQSIYIELFQHQGKAWWRNQFWQKNMVATVFKLLMYLSLAIYLTAFGFFLPGILNSVSPEADIITTFNSLVIFYFIIDFALRLFVQASPLLNLQPYLSLNIKRKVLIKYFLALSFINPFNFLPLMAIIPFWLISFSGISLVASISWLLALVITIAIIHYLSLSAKRFINGNLLKLALVLAIPSTLLLLYASGVWDAMNFSAWFFNLFIVSPLWLLPLLILLIGSIYIAAVNYRRDLFIATQKIGGGLINFRLFEGKGATGALISNEVNLILRNKRPRTIVLFGFILPLVFIGNVLFQMEADPEYVRTAKDFISQFFLLFLMVSYPVGSYGQLLFNWESRYYDRLATIGTSNYTYLNSKWLMLTIIGTIGLIVVAIGISALRPQLILTFVPYLLTSILFMAGVGNYMVLVFGCFARKRLDPEKQGWLNSEGLGLNQFILAFALFLLPILIFVPFAVFSTDTSGLVTLSIMGIAGLVLKKPILNSIVKLYLSNKYEMLEAFRDKD